MHLLQRKEKSFKNIRRCLFTGDLTKPVDRNIIQKIEELNKRLGVVKGNSY